MNGVDGCNIRCFSQFLASTMKPRVISVQRRCKVLQLVQEKRRETRGQSKTDNNKQRHVDEPWMSLVAKQVCLKPVKRTTCADFVAKRRTTLYFLQQLLVTCNNLLCCNTGLNVGGKTRNIVIQLVLQESCKTRCTILRPFHSHF